MRIGIDMIGGQDPGGRGRGIGRYVESFVEALLAADSGNQYTLYFFDTLGEPERTVWDKAQVRVVPGGQRPLAEVAQGLVDRNPDQLDLYLTTSPFSWEERYCPPAKPIPGPHLAALFYDLIPILLDRELYLGGSTARLDDYYERLERLRQYDLLLAISEATCQDALTHLGIPAARVVNISSASREGFFQPPTTLDFPDGLAALGIKKPFILSVSGADPRKNTEGLLRAFARLPAPLRTVHQLVIICSFSDRYRSALYSLAAQHGIADRLVLTGHVPDEQLREAYQHCAAFAFVSHYEGFGLPLVEAMQCGAPVVAGHNSAQPEVVGDAGLLARTGDDVHIAAQLGRVLGDPALAADLRRRGPRRVACFSWAETTRRAHASFQSLAMSPTVKPLLAFFSPLPPQRTGVADYALALLAELQHHYTIHLYHDTGRVPHVALTDSRLAAFDYRLFPRHQRAWNYHAVLYQMGNSPYHHFIYQTLLCHPGVVTLHDPRLVAFQASYGVSLGDPLAHLLAEAAYCRPDLPADGHQLIASKALQELRGAPHPEVTDLDLNQRLFALAETVIVHDERIAERLRTALPAYQDRIEAIPLGVSTYRVSDEERQELRKAYGLLPHALLVGVFGVLHPVKLNRQAVEAFAVLAREEPAALLLFVGEGNEEETRRATVGAGLTDRVRFLGYQAPEDFGRLLRTVDLALNLRQPPTNGENSWCLLHLLSLGVPTIVTDCGSFASFPDDVVVKVQPDQHLVSHIADALLTLARDASARRTYGARAQAYVAENQAWPLVAARYVAVLERAAAARRACGRASA